MARTPEALTTGAIRRGPSTVAPGAAAIALGAGAAAVAALASVTLGPIALGLPVAIAVVAALVREPMALLALFVWVGLYKDQAVVQASPVDVTLLLGLLLAALCGVRWAARRERTIPLGLAAPVAAIGVVLVISLAWTPSAQYGSEKALKFLTLTLLATVAPFFLIEKERDVRRYFEWTVALAAVTAAFTLANPPADDGRLTIGIEGNTIGISHLLCTAALILLLAALTDLVSRRRLAVLGAIALVGVAAAIGSRGPLLSLVSALVVTGVVWLVREPRKVAPVLVAVAVAAMLLPFVSLPQDSSTRLTHAVDAPVTTLKTDPRYHIFGLAVTMIEAHPLLGVGAGGFQSVGALSVPAEDYPHNMLLEVWSELGLIPLVILVASIVTVLVGLWRGAWLHAHETSGRLAFVLIGFFVFNLIETLLTGDLNENRAFWGVFGLAWLVVQHRVPEPGGAASARGEN